MKTVETEINGRYPIRLLPHRVEFHDQRPWWEQTRLASMYETVRPGWTVYDVGAEEGDFTALYRSWVGDEGKIVAVEASPGYWPAIRHTWEGNGFDRAPAALCGFASNVTAWPKPSQHWTPRDEADIRLMGDGWPRASRGQVVPDYGFRHLAQQTAETPQWRLDDGPYRPDALVLDIEGAEYAALEGMSGLMDPESSKRPIVWVSVHPPTMLDWYGKTVDDLLALVAAYEYGWELLPSSGEGELFYVLRPQ